MNETLALSPEELKTLKDILNLVQALTNSLTPAQITGAAAAVDKLVPLLPDLSNPGLAKLMKALTDSSASLAGLIQLLDAYYKSGTIKSALELVTLLSVVKDALGTPTVARLAENVNEFLVTGDRLASELGGLETVRKLADTAKAASQEAAQDQSTIGILGLLKIMKEPQVQKGLKFLLHLSNS